MSIRHSLLALLQDRPRYGYQLRTEFEDRTGSSWPLNIGQVYTTLDRLERDGLVRNDGGDGEGHVIYSITDAGRPKSAAGSRPRYPARIRRGMNWPSSSPSASRFPGRRRRHHPGPADGLHPRAAGLHQVPPRHGRAPAAGRHRPAPGAGFPDLPDRSRGALAGPLRGPPHAAQQPPGVAGPTARRAIHTAGRRAPAGTRPHW